MMTNETKKTAVEWLMEQFWNNEGMLTTKKLEKAKEMEREQTMNFALDYMMQGKPVVDFYNKTYGDNK